jgi:hypothetical protein
LKAEYSLELAQDLKAIHGLDAETELSNILSTESLLKSTVKLFAQSILVLFLFSMVQLGLVTLTLIPTLTAVGLLSVSKV